MCTSEVCIWTRDGHTVYAYQLVVTDQANGATSDDLGSRPRYFFMECDGEGEHGCTAMDLEGYSADIKGAGQLALVYLYKQGFRPSEVKIRGQYAAVVRPMIQMVDKIGRKSVASVQKPRLAASPRA